MVKGAQIYDVQIRHVRRAPVAHSVRYRSHWWLVDIDHLPRVRGVATFEPRDHVGNPALTIRANIDALLAAHGFGRPARVTMLTSARSLGYVFNPLTLFWAHHRDGTVTVIAEVHNTYHQRHAYVLRPDPSGRADTEKQFYVSPFYDISGRYRMSVPEPAGTLAVTLSLYRPGEPTFVASVRGTGRPATARTVIRALLRDPLVTRRARAAITSHGIRLWLRGLRPADRPAHPLDPLIGSPASERNWMSPSLGGVRAFLGSRRSGASRRATGIEDQG